MSKNKYIFLLGTLFLLVSLVKYLFIPALLPPVYFTFEMIGFLSILGLIFYITRNYLPKSLCETQNLERKLKVLEKDNIHLKERIQELVIDSEEQQNLKNEKERLLKTMQEAWSKRTEISEVGVIFFKLMKAQFELVSGIVYKSKEDSNDFSAYHHYALDEDWVLADVSKGDGIHGQALADNIAIEITDIPEDYIDASSGTGSAKPAFIYILPLLQNGNEGVLIEVASFKALALHAIWNEFLESINKMN